MQVDRKYAFLLLVTSLDGRIATKTVLVTPAFTGSPEVSIVSLNDQFNAGSKVVLEGFLTASTTVTSVWNVYTSLGELVPFEALTPTFKKFSASEASSQLTFPLSVGAGSFVGGRTYTFRLTTYSTEETTKSTFSELVMTVNGPPTGGYASVFPSTGDALVTKFYISSPGWTTDSANFPLSYSFAYTTSEVTPFLTLSTSSPKAYSLTTLPAGLDNLKNVLTVQGEVMDVFFASVAATATTTVYYNPAANISKITTDTLETAFLSSDVNLVYQTVNNVATTINIVNCSSAPNCLLLNRGFCVKTAGTCGSCFTGYNGIIGDSNTKCLNATSSPSLAAAVGASCLSDSQCRYGLCTNNVCTAPKLLCPSSVVGTVCSGRGACTYSDPSGNTLPSCTVSDTSCSAACACFTGYGGRDCSLDTSDMASRDTVRSDLCDAIIAASKVQDKSSALLASQASSLLSSYSSHEVLSDSAKTACSKALKSVASLSRQGYLAGTSENPQILIDLVSEFVMTSTASQRRQLSQSGVSYLTSAVRYYYYFFSSSIPSFPLPFHPSLPRTLLHAPPSPALPRFVFLVRRPLHCPKSCTQCQTNLIGHALPLHTMQCNFI